MSVDLPSLSLTKVATREAVQFHQSVTFFIKLCRLYVLYLVCRFVVFLAHTISFNKVKSTVLINNLQNIQHVGTYKYYKSLYLNL